MEWSAERSVARPVEIPVERSVERSEEWPINDESAIEEAVREPTTRKKQTIGNFDVLHVIQWCHI